MTLMCLQCLDKPASIKFCSSSCAATYNNKGRVRSIESRVKTSQSMRGTPSLFKGKEKVSRTTTPCYICGTLVRILKNTEHKNHTCKSDECKAATKSIAGRASANKRVKRSADEIELFNLCNNYFLEVLHNHIIAENWDADIVLPLHKIAILWNGPWHYKDMPGLTHSLLQVQNRDRLKSKLFESLGWKVVLFEDRHYTPKQAFEKIIKMVGNDGTAPSPVCYEQTAPLLS